jgi:HTH-type transcriptional regulator / antitoxin HipB
MTNGRISIHGGVMRARVRTHRDLGVVIRDAREAAGLTQDQLSERLGIDRQYLRRIENGTPNLYVTRLFRAMKALNVDLSVEWPDRD